MYGIVSETEQVVFKTNYADLGVHNAITTTIHNQAYILIIGGVASSQDKHLEYVQFYNPSSVDNFELVPFNLHSSKNNTWVKYRTQFNFSL